MASLSRGFRAQGGNGSGRRGSFAIRERRAPRRTVVQRRRVTPSLPERELDIRDRRAVDLELHVVPRRTRPVAGVDVCGLLVAAVVAVVVTSVAQVDAAHECHVGPVCSVHHDDLLVMTPGVVYALVQQDLSSCLVHALDEPTVLLLAEVHAIGVRSPDEPAHIDSPSSEALQHEAHLGPRSVESFVRVTAPIGEKDEITGTERRERREQAPKVRRAVDEHIDTVAACVRDAVGAAYVDPCVRIAALARREEPAVEHVRAGRDALDRARSDDVVHVAVVPRLRGDDTPARYAPTGAPESLALGEAFPTRRGRGEAPELLGRGRGELRADLPVVFEREQLRRVARDRGRLARRRRRRPSGTPASARSRAGTATTRATPACRGCACSRCPRSTTTTTSSPSRSRASMHARCVTS